MAAAEHCSRFLPAGRALGHDVMECCRSVDTFSRIFVKRKRGEGGHGCFFFPTVCLTPRVQRRQHHIGCRRSLCRRLRLHGLPFSKRHRRPLGSSPPCRLCRTRGGDPDRFLPLLGNAAPVEKQGAVVSPRRAGGNRRRHPAPPPAVEGLERYVTLPSWQGAASGHHCHPLKLKGSVTLPHLQCILRQLLLFYAIVQICFIPVPTPQNRHCSVLGRSSQANTR